MADEKYMCVKGDDFPSYHCDGDCGGCVFGLNTKCVKSEKDVKDDGEGK